MLVKKKNMQFQCNERNIIMGVYELNIKKKIVFSGILQEHLSQIWRSKVKGFL